MGLIFRTTNTPNAGATQIKGNALTYAEGDGNFAWLATNLSGSTVSITGSVGISGSLLLKSLTAGSYGNVLVIDTGSGQLYFTGSIGGSGGSVSTQGTTLYSTNPAAGGSTFSSTRGIFLGDLAGYDASAANNSNFLGREAGYQATNANSSNFLGYDAGYEATNASYSTFMGNSAGIYARNADNSVFIGRQAGSNATSASNSMFVGREVGMYATNANDSTFIGYQAGYSATNARTSNFLGYQAGYQAINVYDSNFFGSGSGYQATDAFLSNFLGKEAGVGGVNASVANFLGYQAGYGARDASGLNALGYRAGYSASNAYGSNFLGYHAGYQAKNASNSNFLGESAGEYATKASFSNFLGYWAGYNASSASYSTLLGYQAGYNVLSDNLSIKSNNIIIGTNITLESGRKDSINLGAIIFATGSYSTTSGDPYSGSVDGRVGINKSNPVYTLDVSGSINFTGNIYQNGSPYGGGGSGTAGTAGTSGATFGTSGTSGLGTSGTSGATFGTSGTSGTGTSGTSGINGSSGTSGANGTSGTSGINGTSGTSGVSGSSGTSGTSGMAGTSGTSGTTGTSGTSGTTGTSGTSGIAGTSGTSGAGTISGTLNYVAKFTPNITTVGDSLIYDNGTNVGVGTATPTVTLQVAGAVSASGQITNTDIIRANTNNVSGSARVGTFYNSATVAQFVNNVFANSSTAYGYMQAGDSTNYIAGSKTVFEYGNVGIGTTAPNSALDVAGTISFTSASIHTAFAFRDTNYHTLKEPGGNNAIYLGDTPDAANYYDNTAHTFRNRGGSVSYVTINSSGNVGVGTTSPTYKLEVSGSTAIYGGGLYVSGTAEYSGSNAKGLVAPLKFNRQSGSYTLAYTDEGKMIEMSSSINGTLTVTVPLNASVPFPIGTEITIIQAGTGSTSIVGDIGVTVSSYLNYSTLPGQNAAASVVKRGTNSWYLFGNITT